MTDLVWSGYFEYSDDFIEYGLHSTVVEYNSMARTIILTEGKTDTYFLKESMKLLYPHLVDYYSFLEFENSKLGGGVGNLTNIVKAFAGSGIVNNIIALFDNDTAAASAIKSLSKTVIPNNIKILKLPDIEVLRDYPTIGPSGNVNLDMNGIAASIELFFGSDVLKIEGENLSPVQWTGYDPNIKKYQGEVIDKITLQRRFNKKIEASKSDKDDCLDDKWDDMRSIFKLLFNAFNENHREQLLWMIDEYYST